MNKYQIRLDVNEIDKAIQVPVMLDWELLNTEVEVDKLESQINQDVAGLGVDFETRRFAHSGYTFNPPSTSVIQPTPTIRTNINYDFYFFSGGSVVGTGSTQNWITNYNERGKPKKY